MNLVFIGGGNMASALIGGLSKSSLSLKAIHVIEPDQAARQRLESTFQKTLKAKGIAFSVAEKSLTQGFTVHADDWVILAVKPQHLKDACQKTDSSVQAALKCAHILSIAAGINTAAISAWCANAKVVRSMPNTPALVNQGINGVFATSAVTPEACCEAEGLLAAVGKVVWIEDESLMDAVTALSGSGPAYVFRFIEALSAAGQSLGLSEAQSKELAIETLEGALALLKTSGESPEVLREKVTSKGGTTAAALASLDQDRFMEIISKALTAARDRGAQMSKEFR